MKDQYLIAYASLKKRLNKLALSVEEHAEVAQELLDIKHYVDKLEEKHD